MCGIQLSEMGNFNYEGSGDMNVFLRLNCRNTSFTFKVPS